MGNCETKVSVICNAYNHEKYIRSALDGFVMQKTNFRFEVLIHDDASTDHTAEIIREYELKYPEIIKPIYETENQYSKNDGSLTRIQYGRVQGKYIAICEGDDYWTDPLKLQKQFDALETHPEVDICAHGAYTEMGGKINGSIVPSKKDRVFSPEEVILGGGGFVATASIMYRSSLEKNIPPFRQLMRLDYMLQIHGSLRGGMLFLQEKMSVYRQTTNGSWTSRMQKDSMARANHSKRIEKVLIQLNEDTAYLYDDCIQRKIKRNIFQLLYDQGDYHELLMKEYKDCFHSLSFKKKVKILILALMSFFKNGKKQ